jgi:hypothetical protein
VRKKENNEGGRKRLVQDRFSVFNAVKAYGGSEALGPVILNLHARCSELLVSCAGCFTQGKEPEDAGWGASTGLDGLKKRNISCLSRESNQYSSVV